MSEGTGDCFAANMNFLLQMLDRARDQRALKQYRLCHGRVTGADNSPVAGQTFDHCWIELDRRLVLDFSNGKAIACPIDKVQHRIHEPVKRYKAATAIRLLLKHEHYGPWDEQTTTTVEE